MKLAIVAALSLTVSALLCWSAMATAKQIAKVSLVKTEAVLEIN